MEKNYLDIVKDIGQPLDNLVPTAVKDKVKIVTVEAGTLTYNGIPFKGLCSKVIVITENDDLEKVRKEILIDLDNKETALILDELKNTGKNKITLVRRKVNKDIAKLMEVDSEKLYRVIIVIPFVRIKESKEVCSVYGFESIIIT